MDIAATRPSRVGVVVHARDSVLLLPVAPDTLAFPVGPLSDEPRRAARKLVTQYTDASVVVHPDAIAVEADDDASTIFYQAELVGQPTAHMFTIAQLAASTIVPPAVADIALAGVASGRWPSHPVIVVPTFRIPAARVRAGGVVVHRRQVALIRREREGSSSYEIPGGGVEANEDTGAAALRELEEETGLVGRILQPLATVWCGAQLEIYYLVAVTDRSFGPIRGPEADSESWGTFEPAWIGHDQLLTVGATPPRLLWRLHQWIAAPRPAWPTTPVVICDNSAGQGHW